MNLSENLLAYYQFEEPAGSARVPTIGTGNLTEGGATIARGTGLTGAGPYAAQFSSSTYHYFDAPSSFFYGKNTWTLSAWIRPTAAGGNYTRFIEFGLNGSNRMTICYKRNAFDAICMHAFSAGGNSATDLTGVALTSGVWNLLTCSISPHQFTVYVSNPTAGSMAQIVGKPSVGSFRFASLTGSLSYRIGGGSFFSTTTENFEGLMDSLLIWDRAVQYDEHLWLYNNGSGRTPAEISGDYTLGVKTVETQSGLLVARTPIAMLPGNGLGGVGGGVPTSGQIWPFKG